MEHWHETTTGPAEGWAVCSVAGQVRLRRHNARLEDAAGWQRGSRLWFVDVRVSVDKEGETTGDLGKKRAVGGIATSVAHACGLDDTRG